MPLRIAIMISGRGSNMVALLDADRAGHIPGAEFALVVSDRANAPGVGLARARGIHTVCIERGAMTRTTHQARIIEILHEHRVEMVCLAGFMRILSPDFVAAFRYRILNIHPSLLPAFPGLHAPRQALEYGVRWTGCTVHFVDEGLDSGPIIEQCVVPVYDADTEETLSARILVEEHKLYPSAVARVVSSGYEVQHRRVVWHEEEGLS